MKKLFSILAAMMLLASALCISAAASDFDHVAQDLAAIGMFRGTDKGFELGRTPTRNEAVITLI